MSVAWRSFFVHESFQTSSTLLMTLIALSLPCNILFVSWSLRDAHLLCTSPFKCRPPSDRFDLIISPVQHLISLLSVAWRDNQRLLRRLTCYSRKSPSALKSKRARREFTERFLTITRLMVHYKRSTQIMYDVPSIIYKVERRQTKQNKKTLENNYQTGKKIQRSPSSPTTKAVKQ